METSGRAVIRRIVVYGAAAALTGIAALALWVMSRPRPQPEGLLARAIVAGRPEEARAALKAGAPPDAMDRCGYVPLVWAAREGRGEVVRMLVEAGADPDRRDRAINGWTPLLHAVHTVREDRREAVRALIAAGADVNRAAPNGLTPLMMAAGQGDFPTFKLLLAAGADPRAEARGGETVLTYAVLGGKPEILEALLAQAPDLRLKNTLEDWAARAIAWARGRSEVMARLDEARRDRR